jgi:hypothetical protein
MSTMMTPRTMSIERIRSRSSETGAVIAPGLNVAGAEVVPVEADMWRPVFRTPNAALSGVHAQYRGAAWMPDPVLSAVACAHV